MSDLGAIFHVKKDGIQYDAHAYTTLDECPYPNIKINFKGQQGYVKLEDKGSGDVPCYVKPKSEDKICQVRKEMIPTGSKWLDTGNGEGNFTVPSGITVIKVTISEYSKYVGVTPNSTHYLSFIRRGVAGRKLVCTTHGSIHWTSEGGHPATLSWSPEINKHSVDISDYS